MKDYAIAVRFPGKGSYGRRLRRAAAMLTAEEKRRRPEFMGRVSINEIIVRAVDHYLESSGELASVEGRDIKKLRDRINNS